MRDVRECLKVAQRGREVQTAERAAEEKDAAKEEKNPRVRFRTSKGSFVTELFEDDAPNAVRNFMDLVLRRQFYDGLRFHRVDGGQIAMVGDPRTRLGAAGEADGPPWRVRPDKSPRGILRGSLVALAIEGDVLHGSLFYVALSPLAGDTGRNCVFGKVVEGMDVVYSLEQDDTLEKVEVLSRRNHAYEPLAARLDR
jgi:peptidyl-prolyl cis-trans isomerase B (cyclophilin B)